MGLRWDAIDPDRGEVVIKAGRVLLDGHRTATDDPKSSASHRTVPVEEIQQARSTRSRVQSSMAVNW
jgi:hypothetical protein